MLSLEDQAREEKITIEEKIVKSFGARWEFEECYKYKNLSNFDATI